MLRSAYLIFCFLMAVRAYASDAEILDAKVEITSAQKYNIAVTVKHADTGWEHYANEWRVYSAEGDLLGERVLYHPHVKEQPFTRSLLGLTIPTEVSEIVIKAVCSETGENSKGYTIKLR